MSDLNDLPLPDLFARFAAGALVRRLLELARDEDLGAGDITSDAALDPEDGLRAALVARRGGVVAGLAAAPLLLDVFGGRCRFSPTAHDGDAVTAGATLGEVSGPARDVLAVERTLLNLVGRLSGVATLTARYAHAARPALVYDTRKTSPGMRVLEKYAVRCGGGRMHRVGLFDAALFKDNHLAGVPLAHLREALTRMAREARRQARSRGVALAFVEAEVDSLDQFAQALAVEPGLIDVVLLDNLPPERLREAVSMRDAAGSRVALEASGGVSLETIGAIAATGVERIAVGAITHSAPTLDVALDVV